MVATAPVFPLSKYLFSSLGFPRYLVSSQPCQIQAQGVLLLISSTRPTQQGAGLPSAPRWIATLIACLILFV